MASRARSAEHWRETARMAEALGYDVLLMPDHITDQLAPPPALVAVADATTRPRVGRFLCDDWAPAAGAGPASTGDGRGRRPPHAADRGARGADRGPRSRGGRARRPAPAHRHGGIARGAGRAAPARAALRGARAERDRLRR